MDHLTAWFIILIMCWVSTRLSMCEYFRPDQRENMTERTNCTLAPVDRYQIRLIKKYIDDGNRLIRFKLNILGDIGVLGETYPDGLIKPDEWVLSTDDSGKSLLFLPEDYIPKSLWTLSFSEKNLEVTLMQTPANCFGANNTNYTLQEIKNTIRYHLLRNFSFASDEVSEGFEVCNLQIITGTDNTSADLKYICCSEINPMCETLKSTKWMDVFVTCLSFVKYFFAPLFSPLLIPRSFYKKSIFSFRCIAKNAKQLPFILRVRQIDQPDRDVDRDFIRLGEDLKFPELRNTLKDLPTGEHFLNINSVDILVDSEYLLECGTSPVTLFSFIVNYFGRCMMRRDDRYLKSCCNNCPSNRCFDLLKFALSFTFLLSPWWVTIAFYFIYDEKFYNEVTNAQKVLGLETIAISNNAMLSPDAMKLQAIIVAILVIVCIPIYIMSFRLKTSVFVHIFHSVMSHNNDNADKWTLSENSLNKVEKRLMCGFLYFPFWCLLKLVQLLVNNIPFFKCYWKAYLFFKSLKGRETESTENNLFTLISMSIISFGIYVGTFLYIIIMYIAPFYIEVLVFTMTGILLNYDDAFKYVLLILLILVYGHQCFVKNVSVKYRAYTKSLVQHLLEKNKDKMHENDSNLEIDSENMHVNARYFREGDDEHDGIAYMIPGSKPTREKFQFFVLKPPSSENQQLIWNAPRLLLFRDLSMNNFCSYIPTELFHNMNLLPKNFCPGKATVLYLKGLREFILVLLFVIFWIIAIFALGRIHELPATVQTIVAVGTGFLPFGLKQLVFKDKSTQLSNIETDYVWQSMFDYNAKRYIEPLAISDIVVSVSEQQEIGLDTACSIQSTSGSINIPSCAESSNGNSSTNIDIVAVKTLNECIIYVHRDMVKGSLIEETRYVDGYQQVI